MLFRSRLSFIILFDIYYFYLNRHLHKTKRSPLYRMNSFYLKRRLSTLPLLRSTIDVVGLNFSVRNGKRWIPNAITTLIPFKMFDLDNATLSVTFALLVSLLTLLIYQSFLPEIESLGLLVLLGFDITALTPVAYQRRSLQRPSGRSYLEAGFVLRCFQHLSNPDLDTRRCTWRYNR